MTGTDLSESESACVGLLTRNSMGHAPNLGTEHTHVADAVIEALLVDRQLTPLPSPTPRGSRNTELAVALED